MVGALDQATTTQDAQPSSPREDQHEPPKLTTTGLAATASGRYGRTAAPVARALAIGVYALLSGFTLGVVFAGHHDRLIWPACAGDGIAGLALAAVGLARALGALRNRGVAFAAGDIACLTIGALGVGRARHRCLLCDARPIEAGLSVLALSVSGAVR